MIRTVICDDEPLARERLRTLLAGEEEFTVVEECATGRAAVEAVERLAPDLLFLDVQMPEMDGFEVLEALGEKGAPRVIFVTAYDKYALAAFDKNAVDYLLKPFDRARFRRALERARVQAKDPTMDLKVQVRALLDSVRGEPRHQQRLVVKTEGRIYFLRADEIDWMESSGNYVRLHAGREVHTLRDTLAGLEERLDPARFVRVHRSTIVNIDRIKELRPFFHGDCVLVLRDKTEITVSRKYRGRLEEVLHGGG
jgi:two-component system LytT family response regulator